jgi:hypothetical protein
MCGWPFICKTLWGEFINTANNLVRQYYRLGQWGKGCQLSNAHQMFALLMDNVMTDYAFFNSMNRFLSGTVVFDVKDIAVSFRMMMMMMMMKCLYYADGNKNKRQH